MGDRGNIVVRESCGDVWLYSHWTGSELKDVLKTVLAKNTRWDDAPYLARMIFSEMIRGEENKSTGFGISTQMCDNEHGILVVDVSKQKVVRMEESALEGGRLPDVLDYRVSRTFEEFALNGFKGKKRKPERRQGWNDRRGTLGPTSLGGRRSSEGRRKEDYNAI